MRNARTKTMLDAVLRRTPVQPVFHWRASRSLAVLAYHDIRDRERFAWQLDHLRRAASPVGVDDVIQAAEGGAGLPHRAVLVTFDDGHRDVLEVAMPLLRERNMPAAAFVVGGLIGTETPHWWTEVKALVQAGGRSPAVAGLSQGDAVRALKHVANDVRLGALDELRRTASRPAPAVRQLTGSELVRLESDGVAIGNHSLTHPCLTTCDNETVQAEIRGGQEILSAAVGHEIDAFAYPDGGRDERVSRIVRETGHRAGFLFDHHLSARRPPDPLNISRLRVDADATPDRFRIIVSGLHPTLHRIRGLR